jgi:hypothetical protein
MKIATIIALETTSWQSSINFIPKVILVITNQKHPIGAEQSKHTILMPVVMILFHLSKTDKNDTATITNQIFFCLYLHFICTIIHSNFLKPILMHIE